MISQFTPSSKFLITTEEIIMTSTVLILGGRGRFGLAAAQAFDAAGWRVLAQMRPGATVPPEASKNIEWLGLALADTQGLASAARGANVVVHALNPRAYTVRAWQAEVLPMADAALEVARALQATLMVPGNVYNFGSDMPPLLAEATPQRATSAKGRIRVLMEQRLQNSGVRCIVIRAGDFFGSGVNSWLDLFVAKDLKKARITYPGPAHVPTAWAYLPDLARSFVAVAERRAQLPAFDVLHFKGYSLTGAQWQAALELIAHAQGWLKPGGRLTFASVPWWAMRLGAWVVPMWASVLEMRYLWNTPHALDNTKLVALIGAEPHTPLDVALQQSLRALGMLNLPCAPAALAAV